VREEGGLADACVTPAGTVIAVGGGHGECVVVRSTDGGRTFTRGAGKGSLRSVASLPDGRVIAGGDEALYASHDDGRSFTRIPYEATAGRSFAAAIAHGGAVYLGGPWQDLVRVT